MSHPVPHQIRDGELPLLIFFMIPPRTDEAGCTSKYTRVTLGKLPYHKRPGSRALCRDLSSRHRFGFRRLFSRKLPFRICATDHAIPG